MRNGATEFWIGQVMRPRGGGLPIARWISVALVAAHAINAALACLRGA